MAQYERHTSIEPGFPIIYHYDTLGAGAGEVVSAHWHENLEILVWMEGSGTVLIDGEPIEVKSGQSLLIGSGRIHMITSEEGCGYHCLIADSRFLTTYGLPVDELSFEEVVDDHNIVRQVCMIAQEMRSDKKFNRTAVLAYMLGLFVWVCRYHQKEEAAQAKGSGQQKSDAIKAALKYIRQHINEHISVEDVCGYVGVSKYYFCRMFKSFTGMSTVNFINMQRCEQARWLILSGKYNISEAAEKCGIKNLSYFSRMYKKYMGVLPSQERG